MNDVVTHHTSVQSEYAEACQVYCTRFSFLEARPPMIISLVTTTFPTLHFHHFTPSSSLSPPSTCVLARCNHLHSLHTVRSHEAAAAAAAAAAAIVHAARGFSVAPNASHMSAQLVTPTGADCTLLHAWCHTPYTPRAGAGQQHC